MVLSRRGVERALTRKLGMELDQRDHRVYRLFIDGQFVSQTKVSRGSGYHTLAPDLVKAMARDLKVSVRFFRELEACTKDLDDYLQLLRDTGAL
jgi:hypothetical protein